MKKYLTIMVLLASANAYTTGQDVEGGFLAAGGAVATGALATVAYNSLKAAASDEVVDMSMNMVE